MADKSMGYTALIVACVIALLVGGFVGYGLMPEKVKTEYKEKEIQIPGPTIEVIKEVNVTQEVPLNAKETYLVPALKDFIKKASKSDDFVYCSDEEYDKDQVKIKSDPNNWQVEIGQDQTTVNFDVRMKYLDKDVNEKCYNEYEVQVIYEDGEKPQVDFSLI